LFCIGSDECRAESNFPFYNTYDIHFYFLDLEVTNISTALSGKVQIDLTWKGSSADTLILELNKNAVVDSVLLNGVFSDFIHTNDFLKLIPETKPLKDEKITVSIIYRLPEDSQTDIKGIFTKKSFNDMLVTYTLSEPFYSKSWFPCKQDLTDKADSVYFYLTLHDTLLAGSNGVLKRVVPLGNGKKRMEWESATPIAYYLISFSVANYLDYSFMASTADGDSVLVQNYIYNDSSYFRANKENIDATADMIELFSKIVGPYPFRNEKYGHCIAPLGGGMEHQTMTTLGDFGFRLVAHELMHQWFGNNVTCSDWRDIWVNEGFASYGEYLAYEGLQHGGAGEWLVETHEYALSAKEGSIYIPLDQIDNVYRIFDYPLTYRKGATIIHMLRHELKSDELFFKVLTDFQSLFGDSVATAGDFKHVAEMNSGRDFGYFFDQWYYGQGYPYLDFKWEQKRDTLFIYVEQTTSAPEVTGFFNLLIDFNISFMGGDTLVQFRQSEPADTFRLPINRKVYQISPDPDEWLLRVITGNTRIMPEDSNTFFNVFPNPATDEVFIENYRIGTPFTLNLFNSQGILLETRRSLEVFTHLKLNAYANGLYQLILVADDKKEIIQLSILEAY
jgi:aminopeptidase N